MRGITLLESKLTIPTLGADLIARERIYKKLDNLDKCTLAVFTAGAGYGKTTALAQYLLRHEAVGWYNPGPEDDHVYTFSVYLSGALDSFIPGIRDWYGNKMNEEEKFDWKVSFSILMAGIELLGSKIPLGILVIDDWQYVQGDLEIRLFFNRFLACCPAMLHVVILSREQTGLSEIERLRAKGQVLDFTEEDLTFGIADIAKLLNQVRESPVKQAEIEKVYEYTEGWVIAIKLLMNRWQSGKLCLGDSKQSVSTDLTGLFEYLAYDVFERQTPVLQNFLLQSALTDSFSVAYCKEVIGSAFAMKLLDAALKRGLFIYQVGNGVYRYHTLFREFLCREAEVRLSDLAGVYAKIGHFYWKRNTIERALPFLLLGEQWQAAMELICEVGRYWVSSGRDRLLQSYIDELPVSYRKQPEIYLALGDANRFSCHYDKAIDWYKKAGDLFKVKADKAGWSHALRGIGETYLDIIQPVHAQEYLKIAYKALPEAFSQEKAAILGLMAENMVNRGNPRRAERYRRLMAGMVPFTTEDKNNLEVRILLRTGRLREVIEILEQRYEREQSTYHVPRSFRETPLVLSLCYSYCGDQARALALAQAGIDLAEKMRSPFVLAIGYVRKAHALLLAEKTRSEAWQVYQTALDLAEKMGISRGKTEVFEGFCLLYALQGNWGAAKKIGLEGIAITETVQDRWFTAVLYHTLGMGAVICEQYEEAETFLKQALILFEGCRDSFGETVCSWWLAFRASKLNQYETFCLFYQRLLSGCQKNGYDFILAGPSLLGAVAGLDLAVFTKWAAQMITSDLPQIGAPDPLVPSLRIQALGPLRVWRDGQEIAAKDWRRGSSRQLLALLITLRDSPANKESLMCELWPEVNGEAALRNFKVAFNSLLSVLEPKRRPRSPSRYIARQGIRYQLLLPDDVVLDVCSFERLVTQGIELAEEAVTEGEAVLIAALSLYRGEYLQGEGIDGFSAKERERLLSLAVKGAELLANSLLERKEYDAALLWAQWILERDPCWERAYQLCMEIYGRLKNPVMVARMYQRCVALLESELGVKPSPVTLDVYGHYVQ